MTTHPNQKVITIKRNIPKNTKGTQRQYVVAYIDAIEAAGKNLNGVAFKLFCYLLSNEHNYQSAFSPKDFTDKYGGSIKSAQSAFKELQDKGYIRMLKGNLYEFYEEPTTSAAAAMVEEPMNEAAFMEKFNRLMEEN